MFMLPPIAGGHSKTARRELGLTLSTWPGYPSTATSVDDFFNSLLIRVATRFPDAKLAGSHRVNVSDECGGSRFRCGRLSHCSRPMRNARGPPAPRMRIWPHE